VDDTFVVVNGKIITDIDLSSAFETHRRNNALATLVLLENRKREKFSVVETRDGLITGFGGMPSNDDANTPLMFTGIQILEPRIFEYIPRGVFSHSTTEVYPQAIAKGERVAAHVAEGKWRELSTLQRYLDISIEMLREKGDAFSRGRNNRLATNARIVDSVLWDNVEVSDSARVDRAVLADNVRIGANEVISNAVVVPRALIEGKSSPEKALRGVVQGENFVVPLSG